MPHFFGPGRPESRTTRSKRGVREKKKEKNVRSSVPVLTFSFYNIYINIHYPLLACACAFCHFTPRRQIQVGALSLAPARPPTHTRTHAHTRALAPSSSIGDFGLTPSSNHASAGFQHRSYGVGKGSTASLPWLDSEGKIVTDQRYRLARAALGTGGGGAGPRLQPDHICLPDRVLCNNLRDAGPDCKPSNADDRPRPLYRHA